MTWFEILQKLHDYRLRKPAGYYTIEFIEGLHRYQYHRHDTGMLIRVWVVNDDEQLLVYDKTEWFSSRYEFNGNGPGWVHKGPWISAISGDFAQFEEEIAEYEHRRDAEKDAAVTAAQQAEQETLSRFSDLYLGQRAK